MTDHLSPVPPRVLSHVRWAMGTIARFNDAIRQCRAIEAFTGSMGRYEWEYRTGAAGQASAAQAGQAVCRLATFAERAQKLGLDPEAVMAALEGETTPLPWSDEARAWLGGAPDGPAQ